MTMVPHDLSTTSNTDNSWLKALEAQSWQAELLISGALAAGLFQLPGFFHNWITPYIINSSGLGFTYMSYASIFIFGAIGSIIVFLGFHLILRGIWISLLGLNSVYPDGVNVESKSGAGPAYWKKYKARYPDLSAYNEELDKKCSLIYSLAVSTCIAAFSLSALVILFFLLMKAIITIIPAIEPYVVYIGIAVYLIITLFALGISALSKRKNNSPKLDKIIFKYGLITGSMFSLYVFRKPINYILGILTSNGSDKNTFAVSIIFGLSLGIFGGSQQDQNPVFSHFGGDKYITFNNTPHKKHNFNYENLRDQSWPVFTPIIPSDLINGSRISLFIPTIDREKTAIGIEDFSIFKKLKLGREKRNEIYKNDLKKYETFNKIFINGNEISNLKFHYFTYPNDNEKGVQVSISTEYCQSGENILEIRKNYFSDEGEQKIVTIPFYYEGF